MIYIYRSWLVHSIGFIKLKVGFFIFGLEHLAADEESGSPGSGDAVSDRYRNPRKRLLQTSASPTTPISCPAGSAGPLLQGITDSEYLLYGCTQLAQKEQNMTIDLSFTGAPIPNDQPDKTKEELQLGPVNGKDSSSTKSKSNNITATGLQLIHFEVFGLQSQSL